MCEIPQLNQITATTDGWPDFWAERISVENVALDHHRADIGIAEKLLNGVLSISVEDQHGATIIHVEPSRWRRNRTRGQTQSHYE